LAAALLFTLASPAANVVPHPSAGETIAAATSPADIDGYFSVIQLP